MRVLSKKSASRSLGTLLALYVIGLCAVLSGRATVPGQDSGRPEGKARNLLLITIDTLRADHVGAYGHPTVKTPNLDALAKEGVLFENAVAQTPLTPPSHSSMFTGNYPMVHGVRDTGGFILEPGQLTLAEILSSRGWETAGFVGSAVLNRVFGLNQGFETYDDQITRVDEQKNASDFPYRRAEEVVTRAVKWLKSRSADKPFFLWVHVFDPHTPYDPPSPFSEQYENPYVGEVAYTDFALGPLLSAIRQDPANDGTLVVALSDHGEGLGEHGEYTHGVFLYDSTLRIPWIISGPGVPRGLRIDQQIRTIDLLPTVLELLGEKNPGECQGTSAVAAFKGRRTGSTYSYGETLFPKINMGWAELRAIRTNKWKYIRAPKPELYDLEKDPKEAENIAQRFPAELRRLENQLREVTSVGVSGAPEPLKLSSLDPDTEARLRSLGYVSLGAPKRLELTGEGIDPKDRVHVLQLLEDATTTQKQVPSAERIALLEKANKEDPGNPAVYYILGEAYERKGRDDDALKLYQSALENEATVRNKIYIRMAGVLGRQGKLDQSIEAFEKAVELDPTDTATQNRLALTYLRVGRNADAERILNGILVLNSEDPQAHNSLGWLASRQGKITEARQHFETARRADPDLPELYLNLGMLYRRIGDSANARQAFETFLRKAAGRAQYKESITRVEKELATMPSR